MLMPIEHGRQQCPVRRLEGRLIDEHQGDAAAVGFLGGVGEGVREIAGAHGVIALLAELGAKQRARPLVGHDQEHAWRRDGWVGGGHGHQEDTTMIRKLASGEYRLYSRKKDPKTGKRRNLGTFKSRAAAEKHERAVQFFKRRG